MPWLLGRGRRLTRSGEYRRVYDKGGRVHGRHMVLNFVGAAKSPGKVGITVSSKVGGAVERNRAKRRLREAINLELHQAPEGFDLVFTARRSITGAEFTELLAEVRALIKAVKGKP